MRRFTELAAFACLLLARRSMANDDNSTISVYQVADVASLLPNATSVFDSCWANFNDLNDMESNDGCTARSIGLCLYRTHTYASPGRFELTLANATVPSTQLQACLSNGTWVAEATTGAVDEIVRRAQPQLTVSSSINSPLQLSGTVQVEVINSSDLLIDCPINVAVGREFECTLTSYRREVLAVVDFGDGTIRNVTIGDMAPETVSVGWQSFYWNTSIGANNSTQKSTESKQFVIPTDGKILAWQFTSSVIDSCEFVIYRPQCANGTIYCYKANACIPVSRNCSSYGKSFGMSACANGSASNSSFSLSRRTCRTISGERPTYQGVGTPPAAANFSTVGVYSVSASQGGCSYVLLPVAAQVQQGDSIALRGNNCSIRQDNASTSGGYDFHLRATIARPVSVKLKHTDANCGVYTIGAVLPNFAGESSSDSINVAPVIYNLTFTKQPATYQATNDTINFTASIVADACNALFRFNWTFGSRYSPVTSTTNATSVSLSKVFAFMDEYLITACAANEISSVCSTTSVVVQDKVSGVNCTFTQVLHPPEQAPLQCGVTSGSDISWRIVLDSGAPTYYNASYALGQGVAIRAARNKLAQNMSYSSCRDNVSYEVTAYNMISNATFTGSFVSLVSLTGVTLDSVPPVPFGESANATLRIASGCRLNFTASLDQAPIALFANALSNAGVFDERISQMLYQTIGRHVLAVTVGNLLASYNASVTFDVDHRLTGMRLSPNVSIATARLDAVAFLLHFDLASRVQVRIDFGDGASEVIYFGGNVSDINNFTHTYGRDGNFTITAVANNSIGTLSASCQVSVYYPIKGVSILFDNANGSSGVANQDWSAASSSAVTLLTYSRNYTVTRTLNMRLNTTAVPQLTGAKYSLEYGDSSAPTFGFVPAPLAPAIRTLATFTPTTADVGLASAQTSLSGVMATTTSSQATTAASAGTELLVLASWTRSFDVDGQYIIRLNLSNPVSNASLTLVHVVYTEVSGVAFKATYVSPTTGITLYGHDSTGQAQANAPLWPQTAYFPLEAPISFASSVVRGNYLTFNWDFGGNISFANTTAQTLNYSSPGTYVVKLNVSNAASYAVFTATIIIQRSISNLNVWNRNGTNVQLLEYPVDFVYDLGTQGSSACYVVDFDTGLLPKYERYAMFGDTQTCEAVRAKNSIFMKPPPEVDCVFNSNAFFRKVQYKDKGMKSIIITGANMVSSSTFTYVFAASDILCGPPLTDASTPNSCSRGFSCDGGVRYVYKSVLSFVKSTFAIDCILPTWYQKYTWTIYRLMKINGTLSELPVSAFDNAALSGQFLNALTLNPGQLDVGRYKFYVNVSVATTPAMYSVGYTILEVKKTPLVIILPGGPSVRMGKKSVTLDALSGSYDPDASNDTREGLIFTWQCRRECEQYPVYNSSWYAVAPMTSTCGDYYQNATADGGNSTDRGCFYDDGYDTSGLFTNTNAGRVTVDLSRSYPGTYIYINVTVSKDTRSTSYEQAIFITEGDPPAVSLRCSSNCQKKFVTDQSFAAAVSVDSPTTNQKYCARWYIQNVTDMANVSTAPFIPAQRLQPFVKSSDSFGFAFSLAASAFTAADNIANLGFQARVWPVAAQIDCSNYGLYSNASNYGVANLYMPVNDVPSMSQSGCSVSPTVNGESFTTLYNISCNAMACQDASSDLVLYDIGWRKASTEQWIWYFRGLTREFKSVQTKLTEGDATCDYNSSIIIVCTDTYGSKTNMTLSVQVKPTSGNSDDILNGLINGPLTKAGGISSEKMMNVIATASFMSQCNTSDASISSKVSNVTDFITSSLAMYPQTSVSDVVMIQTALKLLTTNVASLSLNAAKSAATASSASVTAISQAASLEDAAESSQSVFATIGNLLSFASQTNTDTAGEKASVSTVDSSASNDLAYEALGVIGKVGAAVGRFAAAGGPEVEVSTDRVQLLCGATVVQDSLKGANGTLVMDGSAFAQQESNGTGITIKHRTVSTTNPFATSNAQSENISSLVLGLQLFSSDDSVAKISNSGNGLSVSLSHETPAQEIGNPIEISTDKSSLITYRVPLQANSSFYLNTKSLVANTYLGMMAYEEPSTNVTSDSNRTVLFEVYMAVERRPKLDDYDYVCSVYVEGATVGSWTVSFKNDTYTQGTEVCSLSSNALPRGTAFNVFYGIRGLQPLEKQTSLPGNDSTLARQKRSANEPTSSSPVSNSSAITIFSYSATCSMLDQATGLWTSAGCHAGDQSTLFVTQCICSSAALLQSSSSVSALKDSSSSNADKHFQYFFGASMYVPMNTIDFSDPFYNHLEDTPIVFSVLISIACLYLCCCIWTVRQDRDDELKAMSLMLLDNHPLDEYLYEVAIATGSSIGAGTTSKVCVTFVGSASETPPRLMAGELSNNSFRRGAVDSFVMAVPEPLGDVTHIRVWLCYEGCSPDWWLSSVTLTDIQTSQRWSFLCNGWLSYGKGEGMIDRILPAASSGDMTHGGYLFKKKAQTGFIDSHPWFSVIGRPRRSTFSRTQRLTCCLALLFTMMAANVLFWNKTAEVQAQEYSIGPVKFSLPLIFKGFISSLIVLPINMLIAALFRKSERRIPKTKLNDSGRQAKRKATEKYNTQGNVTKISSVPSLVVQPAVNPELLRGRRKRRLMLLPWWCTIIGYLLSAGTTLAAFLVTVQVGTSFGEERATQWMGSFFTSFFSSLLLVEPSKIITFAMLYVIFIRKPVDQSPDPTQLRVIENKSRRSKFAGAFYNPALKYVAMEDSLRKFKVPPAQPDSAFLQACRLKGEKEAAILQVAKEIVLYAIYIALLFVIVYGTADPLYNIQYRNLNKMLAEGEIINDAPQKWMSGVRRFSTTMLTKCSDISLNCFGVHSTEDFWKWVSLTLIPTLYGCSASQKGVNQPYRYIADGANLLLASPRLRQIRVSAGACPTKIRSFSNTVQCTGEFDASLEETRNYTGFKAPANNSDMLPAPKAEKLGVAWKSSNELGSRDYVSPFTSTSYSGGGYPAELGLSATDALSRVSRLIADGWIDEKTRAVFVEFLLYNPAVNAFAVAELAFEKLATGAMMPKFRVSLLRVDATYGVYAFGVIASEVILFFYYALAVRREVSALARLGWRYFKSFWNALEIIQLTLLTATFAILGYEFYVSAMTLKTVASQADGEYSGAHKAAAYSEVFYQLLAVVIFIAYLKFVKILSFNRVIRNLASGLKYLARSCLQLLLILVLVILGYSVLFYGIYGSRVKGYQTVMTTISSLMLLVLNKTNFNVLQEAEGFIGPTLCVFFLIAVNFFMVSFLISMLEHGLSERVRLRGAKNSKYDFGQYFFGYFLTLLGFGGDAAPLPPKEAHISDDQVDQLDLKLQRLSDSVDVYAFNECTLDDRRRTRLLQQRAAAKYETCVKAIQAS